MNTSHACILQVCAGVQKKIHHNQFDSRALLHTHTRTHMRFLHSLTQPATWFEFLMFPIKIIISFLLIYPGFTDTLQTFKSIWNELMKLQFAGLMNFDKIQTLWADSCCQVVYAGSQL